MKDELRRREHVDHNAIIDNTLARIESLEAKLEKARERFGQVLAAPLIDHSDAHNSKDGVARQALKELSQ